MSAGTSKVDLPVPRHDESRDSTLSSTLILPRLALRRNLDETRFRTYHLSFQTDIIAFSCFRDSMLFRRTWTNFLILSLSLSSDRRSIYTIERYDQRFYFLSCTYRFTYANQSSEFRVLVSNNSIKEERRQVILVCICIFLPMSVTLYFLVYYKI